MDQNFPKQVVDEQGNIHHLTKKIGEGGQGSVFATKNKKLAIKIIPGSSESKRMQLQHQLKRVSLFPLDDLPIAHPTVILRPPYLGYVMELLSDMVPIETIIFKPTEKPDMAQWYQEGGSLGRRLYLLAKTAEVMAGLHGKGIVYADPSPKNIFVSEDINESEVWLIDADNLQFQSSATTSIYTPGYGAPELFAGRGVVNTLTDSYAFAVMAFLVLSGGTHPLEGDMVIDGEPELQEKAWRGELPWIDDPDDTSNFCSYGLPRQIVLSKKLQELCQECFGSGLNNSQKRPGIVKWVEYLYKAADMTIPCPECGSTFYAKNSVCSWCDQPRKNFMLVNVKNWEPEKQGVTKESPSINALVLSHQKPLTLSSRITQGLSGKQGQEKCLQMTYVEGKIEVSILAGGPYWVSKTNGTKLQEIKGKIKIPYPAQKQVSDWCLHFGLMDRHHRVALLEAQ
ncbi:MAG: serine/threonine protein kinase [Candidatus Brocadiae bacterium]|nr:serine/threonine protein kinase [Candidatus Brocadiia bacterium]